VPGTDPFYRQWCKLNTHLLDDPRFYRLTLEERGVFMSLAMYSLKASMIPGRFIHRFGGRMSEEDLADGVRAPAQYVTPAMQKLREAGLLAFDGKGDGWHIPDWDGWSVDNERAKVRAANRDRQARYRRRKGSGEGGGAKNVVAIR